MILREEEMRKLATEAELKALRAQINPHFLFNVLNTIGYLIDTAPERAATTLDSLTRLLRGILHRMDGSLTTLGEELELIQSYLDIERARFEERLNVRIDVPERLRGLQVPALVLQPIVENAVKHGIQSSLDGGTVTIVARVMPEWRRHAGSDVGRHLLSLEVCDTGAGATAEQLRRGRHEGIGLANVERRLRGHYGEAGSMTIASEPGGGTTVELRLPAQEPPNPTALPVVAAGG
jgi:two-component system LytT family sensor kinase